MGKYFRVLTLSLSLFTFNGCTKDEDIPVMPRSTSNNIILVLGASRVEGNSPVFESFRYELWKRLVRANWDFDFIGTQTDDSYYPKIENTSFDINHEGRGGWASGEILSGLELWLYQAGSPDIVLFSSPGGNDALRGDSYPKAVANVNSIIDILQANNPNVTILIEQMAPARSDIMNPKLAEFIHQMQQEVLSIAARKSTPNSQVIAIDMYTGFTDEYLADGAHYNEKGASFIAQNYYNVLSEIMQREHL